MKSIVLPTVIFVLLSLAALPLKAQSTNELIVQVPGVNEKNFDNLKQQFSSVNGVVYSGYCDSEKFFLLTIDRNIQPDNSAVETIFKNMELEFFVKTGTFAAARLSCKDKQQNQPVPVDQD